MAGLVTIAAFTSPWEAHLAKGRLEVEGIPAFVAHEHHVSANWIMSQALGGVKLQVAAEHETMAREIVQAHLKGDYEKDLVDSPEVNADYACPLCGSMDYRSRYGLGKLLLLILTFGLASIIFPLRRDIHHCRRCGHRWRY